MRVTLDMAMKIASDRRRCQKLFVTVLGPCLIRWDGESRKIVDSLMARCSMTQPNNKQQGKSKFVDFAHRRAILLPFGASRKGSLLLGCLCKPRSCRVALRSIRFFEP